MAGHWTNREAKTGCTVLLFDRPVEMVADVRGGAPGTRETALSGPGDLVQAIDGLLMTGGSAFGLEAAGGVMRYLQERGRGFPTRAGTVPIVPAAVIYDLSVGQPVWPTANDGFAACESAIALEGLPRGEIGAGTGATTRKAFPSVPAQRGGLGVATIALNRADSVTAVVVVNSLGEVASDALQPDRRFDLFERDTAMEPVFGRESTTLAAVLVDAAVDRRTLHRCAVAAHDAFARMIRPCHTIYDGDVVFAVGLETGQISPAGILAYSSAVEIAVERAIIDAVTT